MRRIILALTLLVIGAADVRAQTTAALLDTVQHASFLYFWSEANPANGLIKDRSTSGSAASIAAVGFGLSSICVGIDHGWVTREAGRDRVLTTLETFWTEPQGSGPNGYIGYKGFFYHFLNMTTSVRASSDVELSSIDTALLFAGILDAKQYFTGSDTVEVQIRALADSIYRRADWEFMRNGASGIHMAWYPGTGFTGNLWQGYNEAMILYLLALGSPTHPVPATTWTYWMTSYQWRTYYGQSYYYFEPLFGHQYTHCWVDFRQRQDAVMRARGISYFQNSRRATLAQRGYAIANPGHWTGYSDSLWGLTASDVKGGYQARGAPPALNDDGTITPTAPIGSIAFAPDEVIPVVRNMFQNYPLLWGPYGFRDAFNLSLVPAWYDTDYLGIDQGPIVLMIENYLTGSVWNRFMLNPDILTGLARAGFTSAAGVEDPLLPAGRELLAWSQPNPFTRSTTIRFRLPVSGPVRLGVYDLAGRLVSRLLNETRPAGENSVAWQPGGAASGVYYVRLEAAGSTVTKRCVKLQ